MTSPSPADRTAEACSCSLTDPSTWTTYGSAVEPGSTCEWDPYCPVHGRAAEIRERLDLTESVACVADEQTVRDARWLLSENHQLKSRVEELQAQLDKVHAFVNERAQFIQVLRNYVGEDNGDYIRWTGHAEARRVLAETLGIELDKDTGGIRKPVGGPSNGS